MKNRTLITFLSIFLIASFSFATVYFIKNRKAEKQISFLQAQVSTLESEINDMESKVSDLEGEKDDLHGQLDKVQHFDNEDFNNSSSGLAYTGNAMKTKIDGDFEGWEGETIFKMMNGSIWQQSSYAYRYHYAYMPDVLIYSKNGSYYMKVEGVDDEIRVARIK